MSQADLDPNDFIITRKRKKYKFAKFSNAPNCFEAEEWASQPVDVIEIGAGTGLFSVELAAKYPEKIFVALDVKADRLQKGAYEAIEKKLSNIFFLRARADQLDELFGEKSAQTIWVTFADPFPRRSSAGRRMTHPNFLQKYAQVLKPSGELLVKHDNLEFFAWTLEQLVRDNWRINELSFDLHESELSTDYKIMTSYEQRWTGEGRKTHFVKARP